MRKKKLIEEYYDFREKLHFWRLNIWKEFRLWWDIQYPVGKKCFVLGTPTHTNIGDSAIVVAELEFLEKQGIKREAIKEITVSEFEEHPTFLKKLICRDAGIFLHGGGNMGDQWLSEELFRRERILDFQSNPMLLFPQTIYYSGSQTGKEEREKSIRFYNDSKNLVLVARERKSYALMHEIYPDANFLLTPDIVLSTTMEDYGVVNGKRKGIMLCMRNDPERMMTDQMYHMIKSVAGSYECKIRETDMISEITVSKVNRRNIVRQKMQEFADAKLVITDRLHGMVFAAVTGTPCIVFSNYNHKVYGTYEWIKYLPYIRFAESVEDVGRYLPDLLSMDNCKFDNEPLRPYFDQLAEVVKKYANN